MSNDTDIAARYAEIVQRRALLMLSLAALDACRSGRLAVLQETLLHTFMARDLDECAMALNRAFLNMASPSKVDLSA